MSAGISDTDRMTLLRAELEVRLLGVIAAHADLSALALQRIRIALRIIGTALDLRRPELGLAPRREAA